MPRYPTLRISYYVQFTSHEHNSVSYNAGFNAHAISINQGVAVWASNHIRACIVNFI